MPGERLVLAPGDVVAGFTVLGLVGRGGTSSVYRVRDPAQDREVALKLLDVDRAAGDRFRREFAIARALHHPHVLAVYDCGEALVDGRTRLWSTAEYVAGPTASSLVPRGHDEPDLARVLTVAGQVAGALDHVHALDVVHRDVKPANVLLRADGPTWALLSDFGTAQVVDQSRPLARNGRVTGSLPYAAPEVLQAQQLSPATDVYGLACAVVEWLTGRPPFPLPTPFAIVSAHLTRPPPALSRRRPWLPSEVDEVVARALAKDPTDRPATCGEFVAAVVAALDGVIAPGPAVGGRLRRWLGR